MNLPGKLLPTNEPAPPTPAGRQTGIARRIAWLSWSVSLVALLIFAAHFVVEQRSIFRESLDSRGRSVAVALQNQVAGAVINDAHDAVVDFGMELIREDPELTYLVVARQGTFAVVIERSNWTLLEKVDPKWLPTVRQASGEFDEGLGGTQRGYRYSRPFDYSGMEWGWVHVGLSVEAHDRNVSRLYLRTGAVAAFCFALSGIASLAYARRLVRPITSLQGTVREVARGNLSARAEIRTGDEIESLAQSFNTMTTALQSRDAILEQRVQERTRQLEEQVAAKEHARTELATMQRRLMDASRQAGMAEIATGVLHNVGNALNSVNVSAHLVADRLRSSRVANVGKIADMITANSADLAGFLVHDVRGRLIPGYLAEVASHLQQEHASVLQELRALTENVDHAKGIVALQQSHAKVGGMVETLPVATVVEDALKMVEKGLPRHDIKLVRDFAALPSATIDRHKVLQILQNLLRNAKEAIKQARQAGQAAGVITVRGRSLGADRMILQVQDDGIGIDAAGRQKIFSFGFTTKRDGHGFGLHLGVLSAQEMNGSLQVESAGLGQGATCTLELPLNPSDPEGATS